MPLPKSAPVTSPPELLVQPEERATMGSWQVPPAVPDPLTWRSTTPAVTGLAAKTRPSPRTDRASIRITLGDFIGFSFLASVASCTGCAAVRFGLSDGSVESSGAYPVSAAYTALTVRANAAK